MNKDLSEKQIGYMIHALGISHPGKDGKSLVPYKRYRPLPVAYRNYYQVSFCKEWQDLIDKGMAAEANAIGQHYYSVTEKGIAHLKSLGYLFKEEKK